MHHEEKIKQLMSVLRKRFEGQSIRLQPKPNTSMWDDVYEVHVRPMRAKCVTDLDWELKESGPIDLIARNNGVFFHENNLSESSSSDGVGRGTISSRIRRL